jgi:hypothetical protein
MSGGSSNVERENELKISFQEGVIKRSMTIYLKNNNNYVYETYIRIKTGVENGFSPSTFIDKNKSIKIKPEIFASSGQKEAGVKISVDSNSSGALMFEWDGPFVIEQSNSEYLLDIIKQPGINMYPIKIYIEPPKSMKYIVFPSFSLTQAGILVYNTDLSGSLPVEINWKK